MELVADLHLHSKYSRAVSPQMEIAQMVQWARVKGINLLGTGDFTHPIWFRDLRVKLEERDGILSLKGKTNKKEGRVGFVLTTEISSVYSVLGRTRKVHNLILAPSFASVEKINKELESQGICLISDGRPTVGLSARNLLELVMEIDENCLVIPAHAWTPWFSIYGSKAGFDSITECFGSSSKYIYAVETGLSSDPGMNWQIEELDTRSIVSFSDAHSLANLGREVTVFETDDHKYKTEKFKYSDIAGAIKKEKSSFRISNTLEFYPQEGKYHYTGHRKCGVIQSPWQTAKKGTVCPVCGKPLTVGVMERVAKLGRSAQIEVLEQKDELGVRWFLKKGRPKYATLVPLAEIVAEVYKVGDSSRKVMSEYERLINSLGTEHEILTKINIDEISKAAGEKLAEGIARVRAGEINIEPGYDGQYGRIKIWNDKEKDERKKEPKTEQGALF